MKASLKFRDDQPPLLRAKLPLSLAGFPLLSGIAVGNSQDLTLQVGTFFKAGPSCKITYKPNNGFPSPLCFVLKTGFGLWGSPNAAALTMAAVFSLSGKGDPLFSVHVKPKIGDFGFRKYVTSSSNPGLKHDSIQRKSLWLSPLANIDTHASLHKVGIPTGGNIDSLSPEGLTSSTSDSNVVIGSNFSFKIEGLDREKKGRERKAKVDAFIQQQADRHSGTIGDFHDYVSEGEGKSERTPLDIKGPADHASARAPFGFEGGFKGWSAIAHSCLPLGKHAKINVRWGVKVPSDIFANCGSRSGFSLTNLPLLFMDKVSVEKLNPATKERQGNLPLNELTRPFEYDFLPYGISEDSQELAHVAALYSSMKRQLQFLYTENRFLRRAVEEMRAEFDHAGAWKSARLGEIFIQDERGYHPQLLDDSQKRNGKADGSQRMGGMEDNRKDKESKKDRRDLSRKDSIFESNVVSADKALPSGGSHSEVAEELKKAIRNAPDNSSGQSRD